MFKGNIRSTRVASHSIYELAHQMASATSTCRLCSSTTARKYLFGLFTPLGEQEKLSDRLSALLLVPITKNDRLPQYICRKCKEAFLVVERKLKSLRIQAKNSFDKFQQTVPMDNQTHVNVCTPESRMRPKHTSSLTGVSPFTAIGLVHHLKRHQEDCLKETSVVSSIIHEIPSV